MTINQGIYNNEILDPGMLEATGLYMPDDGTGLITINAGDPATIDISATTGVFTNPETGETKKVEFAGVTAHTPLNFGSNSGTFYYFDINGGLVERNLIEVGSFIRSHVMLGITSDNGTIITGTSSYSLITRQSGSVAWHELLNSVQWVKRSGLVVEPNGANLALNMTAGVAIVASANNRVDVNNPHINTYSAITGTGNLIFELWRSDGVNGETLQLINTAIQAGVYDDGTAISTDTSPQGVLQPNKWTVHHVFFVQDFGVLAIQYGQSVFDNAVDAVAGVVSSPFETLPSFTSVLPACALLVRGAATDLSTETDGIFRVTDKTGNFR